MREIKIRTLVEAVKGQLFSGNEVGILEKSIKSVSKDSKEVGENCLFVPITGERFDGHDFIEEFFEKGGLITLTEKAFPVEENRHYILVDDARKSLLLLAEFYRNQFTIPLIAVTGSSGKTTTKDMITCILRGKYNVLSTNGNHNNDIGVPFTIFRLEKEHEVAVIEMGMSQLNEIRTLAAVTNPNIGVITNIGVAHIENLKTRENILTAKCEVFDFMKETGKAILNRDDDMLCRGTGRVKQEKVWFGVDENSQVRAENIRHLKDFTTEFTAKTPVGDIDISLSSGGNHMVSNALSGIAVGIEMGLDLESIKLRLEKFKTGKDRMDIIKLPNGITLINDVYNANPTSMQAAIDSMKPLEGRKVGIFGYMGELGSFSEKMHRELGNYIGTSDIEIAFYIGECGEFVEAGATEAGLSNIYIFRDQENMKNVIRDKIKSDDVILVKGSRSMKLENIVKSIIESVEKN